jgi:DNA-directed RNA polymerase subunit N (RpoN/RPB10)
VTRTGADIGIRCLTCGRSVMLPRSKFEKQVKALLNGGDDEPFDKLRTSPAR